jgi:hypothetical protein
MRLVCRAASPAHTKNLNFGRFFRLTAAISPCGNNPEKLASPAIKS